MNDDVLLSVNNLKQYFGAGKKQVRAVDGVTFDVKKGEVFSLVGESGSGKTTTGRAVIGLYELTDGEIFFKGERIAEKGKRRKFHREMQMIFQDPVASLNPRMTVQEIVAEGLYIGGERNRRVLDEKVYETLELVGLSREHASRYPHEFSGGQRQRIGIARALALNPELIIADEPVSALDVSIQAQVINLLNDLKERLGLTVLFIAHDLSVVKYFSDRVAVMRFGQIVEIADAETLFSQPLHPYTKSLLSAIPLPDPKRERARTRVSYDPETAHNYQEQPPAFREIAKGRFVLCNDEEERRYKEEIKEKNKRGKNKK